MCNHNMLNGPTSNGLAGTCAENTRRGKFHTLPFAFEVVVAAALGNPGWAGESGAWGGVEWNGRWVWVAEGERNPRIMREAIGMSRSRVVFGFLVSRFLWFECFEVSWFPSFEVSWF